MRTSRLSWPWLPVLLAAMAIIGLWPPPAESDCCYFAAKDKDILQPAQKAFITFDPQENVECFTVQPRFEGNAQDLVTIRKPGLGPCQIKTSTPCPVISQALKGRHRAAQGNALGPRTPSPSPSSERAQ